MSKILFWENREEKPFKTTMELCNKLVQAKFKKLKVEM
jgi:hypothetical protein